MKNLKQTSKSDFLLRYTKMAILALILIATASSCSKNSIDEDEDDDGSGYNISFKANGTLEEFKSDNFPRGSFIDNGTQYTATFTGVKSSSSVQIQALDNKAIVEKDYTGYFVKQATQTPAYVIGALISFQQGQISHKSPYENPDVIVKIEQITATTIRGKFSGTLKSNGKADILIKQGEFFVPRNNI